MTHFFFYPDQIVLAGRQLKEAEETIERFERNLKKLDEFSNKFKNSAEINVIINVEARDKNIKIKKE